MADKTDKDVKRLKQIVANVKEESKIMLDQWISEFEKQRDLQEIRFPNMLSNTERAYVHFQATRKGFKSFSTGIGSERQLTLRRATENTAMEAKTVTLTKEAVERVSDLVRAFPNSVCRREIGNGPNRSGPSVNEKGLTSVSRLSRGPLPRVPREAKTNAYLGNRSRLPIWEHRDRIVELIEKNRVVFIQGSTGCGKTTQVGQFILEHACFTSQKVRVICTVPRRIAAVSVSERVAFERGERLGQTVGYQIRLESVVSPTETLLTYCTSGILLRSLTGSDYRVLNSTTHIIIDEIHERDRQTDFLLTCLRDILSMFPNLRLIVMGANLDNELFSSYFGSEVDCPIIRVEGRLHPVEVHFLEDVLTMLQYENNDMKNTKKREEKSDGYNRLLEKLTGNFQSSVCLPANEENDGDDQLEQIQIPAADDIIKMFWQFGDEELMMEFLYLVESQQVPVNYKHSQVGVTMLMAAAVRGEENYVKILLDYGADLKIKSKGEDYEFSAIDWAADHRQHCVLKLLMEREYEAKLARGMAGHHMDSQTSQRLASYLSSIDEERVDLMLILCLLNRIHRDTHSSHAILVFLPGYDEIVTMKHLITTDKEFGSSHKSFRIFMLHSNIQTGDQRAAFDKPPMGTRKIVLSTNIAESSLTIEDIVYVIDSGKVKEKSFDSLTNVTQLKSVWISKASVNQRRGRAGRCRRGVCYHLFSSARYESMTEYPIPEIMRTSLQELCLQARSFVKTDVTIGHFFSRIPEPPAPIAVKKSVELLTVMGALDKEERLTTLGTHLLDFPVEPFLGKALIFAIVFRCLDPILTLVAVISYRDPFQLPSDPQEKQRAHECKARFAQDSFSDHMAYLKAFQDWEKLASNFDDSTQRRFCREQYLSSVSFEMIYAIRMQLLGQLRASGFVNTKGKGDLKELNMHSSNWALVKGVLVATLYPNICGVDRSKKVLYNSFNSKVAFHPSTTVIKKKNAVLDVPTDWIIFDEMTQQGSVNLVKGCTCVSTAAIALFASTNGTESSPNGRRSDAQICHAREIKINQWITLTGTNATIDVLNFLREKIRYLVLKRLESPSAPVISEEQSTIDMVAALLSSEDRALGFKNIDGIDQWPRLVSGNLMSAPKTGFGSPEAGASLASRNRNVHGAGNTSLSNLWH